MPLDLGPRMRVLEVIDMQAGGDVSRIVVGGVTDLPGDTVLAKARYLESDGDGLRRLLLSDPYGDSAMSVDLVVPPSHPAAEAGYIIMEAMGYPPYSGSNTLCTATAILQAGLVEMPDDGVRSLTLESPAGLAHITADCAGGRVQSVTAQGEPAFVAARGRWAQVPGYGRVDYDLVWSGGFYALVDAAALGFELVRDEEIALAAFGDAFMRIVHPDFRTEHPVLGFAGPLPFLHFCGPLEPLDDAGYRARSATYVHPGVICRSPTGTGTSARLARMVVDEMIGIGGWLDTTSPRGSSFRGIVRGEARVGDHRALDTTITGRAWTLSHTRIMVDLDDPMVDTSDLEHLLG
jgi:trans-L-3-hydroxyproline dehydratase